MDYCRSSRSGRNLERKKAIGILAGDELPKPVLLMVRIRVCKFVRMALERAAQDVYPSTFVLDTERVVKSHKISQSHGDRAATKEVQAAPGDPQSEAHAAQTARSSAGR